MIHSELLADKGILIIKPQGPLQKADFEALAQQVDPYIQAHGGLHGLLIQAKSFPGWADFAGFLAHMRFVKHHQQYVAKIAAVTAGGFLTIMPRIMSHFLHAEIRHFDYGDKDKALAWLQDREELQP